MKPPIFVRSFSEKERETIEASLRSKDAFTLPRSQMLLASSRGEEEVARIATSLGCGQQTVLRDAIHDDFNARGTDALAAKSSPPKRTRDAAFDEKSADALRGFCCISFSKRVWSEHEPLWTLSMSAEVAFS